MKIRDVLVPDEVQSAAAAAMQMLRVVTQTSFFWLKHAIAAGIPIAIGAGVGYWLSSFEMVPQRIDAIRSVVTGILTFVAVLAGFMVTLMLFTGRTDGAKSLRVDAAELYVEKVTYLLFSQALTLAIHLLCALCCIAWLMLQGSDVVDWAERALLIATFGLLALSMLRALLLPLQIYEVHHFELRSVVDEKIEEQRQELAEAAGTDLADRKDPRA